MISEELCLLDFHVSRAAVTAFLKGEGILRSLSESQILSHAAGRQKHNTRGKGKRRPGAGHHTKYDRVCEHCNSNYKASSSNQKWCDVCTPDNGSTNRMRLYGISKADFDLLLAKQNGTCALCPRFEKLVVDHDHATNSVRGLLCYRCNIALGAIDSDKSWSKNAEEYIRLPRPP